MSESYLAKKQNITKQWPLNVSKICYVVMQNQVIANFPAYKYVKIIAIILSCTKTEMHFKIIILPK